MLITRTTTLTPRPCPIHGLCSVPILMTCSEHQSWITALGREILNLHLVGLNALVYLKG